MFVDIHVHVQCTLMPYVVIHFRNTAQEINRKKEMWWPSYQQCKSKLGLSSPYGVNPELCKANHMSTKMASSLSHTSFPLRQSHRNGHPDHVQYSVCGTGLKATVMHHKAYNTSHNHTGNTGCKHCHTCKLTTTVHVDTQTHTHTYMYVCNVSTTRVQHSSNRCNAHYCTETGSSHLL